MDGKSTINKSMRHLRHLHSSGKNPFVGLYTQVGDWRFQENEDGDLVIMNIETDQKIILVKRIESNSSSENIDSV